MVPTRESAKALLKGLDVLEALGAGPRELTLAEIARAVGFKKPTAHRILRVLEARGYVERHRETGAQHLHIAADNPENVFLVALRTVPHDSTGVAHIISRECRHRSGARPGCHLRRGGTTL